MAQMAVMARQATEDMAARAMEREVMATAVLVALVDSEAQEQVATMVAPSTGSRQDIGRRERKVVITCDLRHLIFVRDTTKKH